MAATTSEILLKLKMISDVSDVTGNVKQIQQVLNKIDMPKDLKQKFTGVFADLERETKNYQNLLNSGFKGKKDVTGLEASGKRINALMKTLETSMKGIRTEDLEKSFRVDPASIQRLNKELTDAQTKLQTITSSSDFQKVVNDADKAAEAMSKISKTKFTGSFLEAVKKGDIQGVADALKQLEANHKSYNEKLEGGKQKNEDYATALKQLRDVLTGLSNVQGLQETNTKIQNLKTDIGDINITELQKFLEIFQNGQGAVGDMTNQVKGFVQANNDAAVAQQRTNSELDQLKSRIGYFFSLTNSVQLFKRAVTSALNTVKELDKTMTEAAVVTEFDVGDMWNKLPQYAKEAQKLGVSINGMYQATTLYYQQGLKTNAAMQLGIETMKMAKIAGIDSIDATKAMTAALRGFNMELNETSATRVNDVYSQLAAVTAADTAQISTAMEKTASIAASANMEFETTAALLAQIIETTQEAPDTAGTAMKTIIARFAEVKSLREKGLTSGQDEEGEGIDVNKVQAALRAAGISMEGFFAGTEGLDSILLKLAEKWDTLNFETQRYIATTAAGSRQQSRFIAMMSDYSRTTELVAEAQNSAGASQRQFNKTLESMESKLQKLENAWNEFLMGIANNEVLKGAVDFLTNMVEGINNATKAISGGNGLLKSVISLTTAIAGIQAGKAVFNSLVSRVNIPGVTPKEKEMNGFQRGKQSLEGGRGYVKGFVWKDNGNKTAQDWAVARNQAWGGSKAIREQKRIQKNLGGKKNYDKESWDSAKGKYIDSLNEKSLTPEQLKQVEAEYDSVLDKTHDLGQATAAANAKVKEFGGTFGDTEVSAGKFSTALHSIDFAAIGQGAMMAGGACMALASIFSMMGLDDAAEGAQKVGVVFMGLGAAISLLPPIIKVVEGAIVSAGVASQAAWWWILPIVAILAAIALVVVAIVKSANSLEKQLESVNSQIDQMNTAAKEAAESLEQITDTREELAEMQSTFKGLVKGTDEWRKALVDSNAKVLELLDTYPQLAKYITTTEDGLMEIDSAGWNEIVEQQTQAIINTQAVSAGLQTKKTQIESQMLNEEFAKGDMSYVEYKAKKKNYEIQQQATAEAFRTSAIASSDYLSNSDYAQNAAVAVGLNQTGEIIAQEIEKFINKNENEDEMIRKYAEIVGKSEDQVREQVKNDELTKEDMATAIATQKVNKETAKQMEAVAQSISNIRDKDAKKTIQAILTKDGKGLKQSDIEYIKKKLGTKTIGEYLSSFGITLDDEALKSLEETLSSVTKAYATNLTEKLQGFGFKEGTTDKPGIIEFIESTDYGTSQALVEKITDMKMEGASNENINSLMLSIQGLINGLDVDEEVRDNALTMLAESNWESKESIIGTIDYLKSLDGADIEGLDELSDNIIELNDAVSENTTAQLRDKGYALSDLIEEIKSGAINEDKLTDDQKKQVQAAIGAKDADFVKIGTDAWQYNGDLYSKTVTLYADTVENGSEKPGSAKKNYDTAMAYAEGEYSEMVDLVNKINWNANLTNESDEDIYDRYYNTHKDEFEKSADYEGALGNKNPDDFDGTDEYKKYFAIYMKNAISDSNGSSLDMLDINEAAVRDVYSSIATTLGEDPDNSKLSLEEVLVKINEWDEKWKNTDEYKTAMKNERAAHALSVQSNLSTTTAQLGWEITGDEETQKKYNRERSEALEQRLFSTGGTIFVDKIEKEVKKAGGEVDKFADAINGLASDMAVVASKTKTFAENMDELSKNLNKDKRGTVEYGQALGQAKINVADYFGISLKDLEGADISDQLYEELAAGNPAALTQMQNNIASSVMAGTIPLQEAFANATITPRMDQAAIEALYYQLGGAEGSFNTNMNESLKYIQSKLAIMGTQFAYQIDQTGGVSALTTKMDYSSLFKNYVPKGSGSKYKNSQDKFYNTYEKVNSLLREREKLERQYDKILNNRSKSSEELIQNSREQLANLAEQKKLQKYLQKGKLQEINDLMSENSKYSKYVTGFDSKTGTISINWDKFEKIKDSDKGSEIEDYLAELEKLRDQWQEAQDSLEEIEDNTEDIKKEGRDEYLELENRLKDALVGNRQKEIDKLSEINDSINDTNSKLLDSMQQQIDEYRQNRDNEKTEKELEDKQRRLAYLQQDTSGANAMEILNLQKEIEEGQESYTDQLIDQKISELQKQNDEAAEQRQRQIDLLQDQLDHDEENGKFWPEVSRIMKDVINGNSAFAIQLLQGAEGYKGMSEEQKQDFNDEFSVQQKESAHYEAMKNLPEEQETKEEKAPGSGKIASLPSSTKLSSNQIKDLQAGLNELDKDGHLGLSKKLDVDGVYGPKTKEAVKLLQRKVGSSADGIWGPNTYNAFHGSNLSSYKTGGLADFTGPAWLDGTKSKPEYILNADQTRAFFTLVDVLTGLTSKGAQSTQNNGDTNYDIDINVESIGSDYDVEQLASKIKGLINEDARYRNNNAINLMR